jgi:ubiquinone/menaquinone biosynthesis C-methylase UbiE
MMDLLMLDHRETYNSQADQYERLVSREDHEHNLLPALNQIRPLTGLDIVELGAGTGRLTCLVAPLVKSIRAFDASAHMLQAARAKLEPSGLNNWQVAAGDHRHLPIGDAVADIALAGWTIAQLVAWNLPTWQSEVDQVLAEMRRILRTGGTLIILDTLGTASATPRAPDKFVPYYSFLESSGFASTWIRTDFQFESPGEARTLLGFFFGDENGEQMVQKYGAIVPECTGLWWLNL